MRRADEHLAVAARRGLAVQRHQPVVQDVARLFERHRSNIGHRTEVRQRLQYARWPAQRASRQRREAIEPLTPRRALGPLGQHVDDRQCELPQMRQVPRVALVSRDPRGLRLLLLQLVDPVAIVGREAVQPPPPARLSVRARPAADHRRLHDQLFPFPRRPQRAGDDRLIVGVESGRVRVDVVDRFIGGTGCQASRDI